MRASPRQKEKTLFENTLGVCSKCGRIIPANLIEINGKVFLEKNCCEKERALLENDSEFYKDIYLPFSWPIDYINIGMNRRDPKVMMRLLRDSPTICFYITTSCNLNCPICYLKFTPLGDILNDQHFDKPIEKIENFLKMFRGKYIAINGGEPTLREDLPEIIKIAKKYKHRVGMGTNGLRFIDRDYTKSIKEAGIDNVSFSFDGFDDKIYRKLRNGSFLKYKLMALKNLKDFNINVFLYMTVERGLNENDIKNMINFAARNGEFIKGVVFNLLEREDPLFENKLTSSDVYKIIERDIGISLEHFKEEKKFRFLFYNLMEKIFEKKAKKIFSYIKEDVFYLDVSNKKPEPLLTINEYKKYNTILERALAQKSKLKATLVLLKNIKTFVTKKTMKLLIPFMLSGFSFANASIKMDSINQIVRIKVGNIVTEHGEDLNRKETTEAFGIITKLVPR